MIIDIALGIVLGVALLIGLAWLVWFCIQLPWDFVGAILSVIALIAVSALTWLYPDWFESMGIALQELGVPPIILLGFVLLYYGTKYLALIIVIVLFGQWANDRFGQNKQVVSVARRLKKTYQQIFGKGWLGIPKIVLWPMGLFVGASTILILGGFILLVIAAAVQFVRGVV